VKIRHALPASTHELNDATAPLNSSVTGDDRNRHIHTVPVARVLSASLQIYRGLQRVRS
jgi:hypothetical protein